MKKTLTMPRLRPEMEKGTLAAWLVEPGDQFGKGDAIYEVETDKVVNQIDRRALQAKPQEFLFPFLDVVGALLMSSS